MFMFQKNPFWQRSYDRFQFAVENRHKLGERPLDWDAIESAAAAVEPLREAVYTVVGRSDDNDDKWEPIGAALSLYSALRDRLELTSPEENVEGEEMILVESTLNRIKYGIRHGISIFLNILCKTNYVEKKIENAFNIPSTISVFFDNCVYF